MNRRWWITPQVPGSGAESSNRRITLSVVAQPKKTSASRFAEYSGLAVLLPASTFVGYGIGYWLDRYFGTTWLRILFLLLGSVAGFAQLIRQIMRDSNDDDS
jgi:F0F1-type ATP synthase assembly protein I